MTRKGTTERLEKISYHAGGRKNLLSRKERDHSSEASSVVARQARPDLSYEVSKLQSRCDSATIRDPIYANDAVQEAKQHASHGMVCRSDAVDWKNMILVTISDASWSNETEYPKGKPQKHRSQRARMTVFGKSRRLGKGRDKLPCD